jgi:hypothetical protein
MLMKNVPEDQIKSFKIINYENDESQQIESLSKEKKEKKEKKDKVHFKKHKGKVLGFKKKNNDKNKNKPLFKAQDILIEECIPSKDVIDDIKMSLNYVNNWEGKRLYIDTSNDNIEIEHNKKKFVFSKKRFFSNKVFLNNLVLKLSSLFDKEIWLNVIEKNNPTHIESSNVHILIIKKKYSK